MNIDELLWLIASIPSVIVLSIICILITVENVCYRSKF